MASKPRLPPAFERVIKKLPRGKVCMPADITNVFNQLDHNPFEDVNSPSLASENRITSICKMVLKEHNQQAQPGDQVQFCPVRDGCASDASYYIRESPVRRIQDLDGILLGAQNKVFRFNRAGTEAEIFVKVRCAELYDGLLMVLAMSGVPGFWIVPWSAIKLRTTDGRAVNRGTAPGRVCERSPTRFFAQSYTPEALAELTPFWTPAAELPARLLQFLRGRSSIGEVCLSSFMKLNTPTSLWQRCELAGNIRVRLIIYLALGWDACYPEEEQAHWDVGFIVPEERKLVRGQEKTIFVHEGRDHAQVHLVNRQSTPVYSYGPEEKPKPVFDMLAYTANGFLRMMSAKEAFDKGLLRGSRNGEEVIGERQDVRSRFDLDTFTSLLSSASLKHAKVVCEAALEGVRQYEANRAPVELPTEDIIELLKSELAHWVGAETLQELVRLSQALRAVGFQGDASLETEYKAAMLRALGNATLVMEGLSRPFRHFDVQLYPVLNRFSSHCFWRQTNVPRVARLSTITEVYRGSTRGLQGVTTAKGSTWEYEVASIRKPTVRIARGNGFPTKAAAGRAYDRALAALLPVPPVLFMLNATRIAVSGGAYMGLKPQHTQKEVLLRLAAAAEVDPMSWFGEDPQHAAYVGVRRTPPEKVHLGFWETRVQDGVKGHFDTPEEAADCADRHLRASEGRPNYVILGIESGRVAATIPHWREAGVAREVHAQLAELQDDDDAAELAATSANSRDNPLPEWFLLCRTMGERGAVAEKALEAQALVGAPEPPPARAPGENGKTGVDKDWLQDAPGGGAGAGEAPGDDGGSFEEYRRRFLAVAYPLIDKVYRGQDGAGPSSLEFWGVFEQLKTLHNLRADIATLDATIEVMESQVKAKAEAKGLDPARILQAAAAKAGLGFGPGGFESYEAYLQRMPGGGA